MCCLVYFTSYVTRINYGASIAEIIVSLKISKSLASMAVTGSFIAYGVGQIGSGIVGDHIKPKTMIFLGLFVTSVCNIVMGALSNVYAMTVVWCINGLAQSMLWPPLTRIMSENLEPDAFEKTCVAVSASASAATIFLYLVIPLFIQLSGWRAIFMFSAACGFAVSVLWVLSIPKLTSASHPLAGGRGTESLVPAAKGGTRFLSFGLVAIMVVVMLQGILRDGITTWMPSYLNDVYHFGTSISILSTAILPVFSIASVYAASYIHKRMKGELKASALIWIAALLCSFGLIFVFSTQVVVSVLLMVVITACMHGINLMLVSVYPARYKNTGRVSTISGIINACTYAGSAISSFGIAALSDFYGWGITIIAWCVIAACGTLLTVLCVKKYKLPAI